MRRLFSVLSATLLVVAAFSPASAREKRSWEETQEYGLADAVGADTEVGVIVAGVQFNPARATTVELVVEDTAAPATAFSVEQAGRHLGTYCTSTQTPIDLAPRQKVSVHLFAGVCDGGPSFITTGLVRARFSR